MKRVPIGLLATALAMVATFFPLIQPARGKPETDQPSKGRAFP